jgi:hypothetical protein
VEHLDRLSRLRDHLASIARELALLKSDGDQDNFIEDAEDLADEAASLLRRHITELENA